MTARDDSCLGGLLAGVVAAFVPDRPAHPFPDDPVLFCRDVLGADLWEKQVEVARAVAAHRRVAVRSCHASGKSFLAARLVLWFLHTRPHSIVLTTAPTQNQVRNILWRNVGAAARAARRPLPGRALQMSYEIAPDWYGLGFKAEDTQPDRFQGFHAEHALVVIDEAAGVAPSVYAALDPVLSSEGARLLLIGNPTTTGGPFHAAFHENRALHHCVTIRAEDTPNFLDGAAGRPYLITPRWVEDAVATHGAESPYVRSRVHAEFPVDGDDHLIPLAWIEAADARRAGEDLGGAVEAGLDVARYGADENALCVRRGPQILAEHAWSGVDTMTTVGRVRHLLEPYPNLATVKIDAVGVGGGVVDRLLELKYPVVPVNVGGASSDPVKWANLRHEFWWELRERFHDGEIRGPIDDVTMGQLSRVAYRYDSRHSRPVIESKEAAKRRGVRSPDRAEAMMLAFFTPRPTRLVIPIAFAAASGWSYDRFR